MIHCRFQRSQCWGSWFLPNPGERKEPTPHSWEQCCHRYTNDTISMGLCGRSFLSMKWRLQWSACSFLPLIYCWLFVVATASWASSTMIRCHETVLPIATITTIGISMNFGSRLNWSKYRPPCGSAMGILMATAWPGWIQVSCWMIQRVIGENIIMFTGWW